jgi:hypothetical protein
MKRKRQSDPTGVASGVSAFTVPRSAFGVRRSGGAVFFESRANRDGSSA